MSTTKNVPVPVPESSTPVPLTDAERTIVEQLEEQEAFNTVPFIQCRSLAEAGTRMTIVKVGTRFTTPVGKPEEDAIEQLCYLVELQDSITYKDREKVEHRFDRGTNALVCLAIHAQRLPLFNLMKETVSIHGSIPNMTLRELPLTARQRANGWSPALAWCHSSKWKALTA